MKLVAQPEEGGKEDVSHGIKIHGGSDPIEHIQLIQNFQKQVLSKLAISDPPKPDQLATLLHTVVPLGFQNKDAGRAHDVALILFRALDYHNVQTLF